MDQPTGQIRTLESPWTFEFCVMPLYTSRMVLRSYMFLPAGIEAATPSIRSWHGTDCEIFDITDDEEETALIVAEASYVTFASFATAAISVLQASISTGTASLCMQMYDGGFGGSDEMLHDQDANRIYGVNMRGFGPVACFDHDLMQSSEWRAVIARARTHWESLQQTTAS